MVKEKRKNKERKLKKRRNKRAEEEEKREENMKIHVHQAVYDEITDTIGFACKGRRNRSISVPVRVSMKRWTRKLYCFFYSNTPVMRLFLDRTRVNNPARRVRWLTGVVCDLWLKGAYKRGQSMTRKSTTGHEYITKFLPVLIR